MCSFSYYLVISLFIISCSDIIPQQVSGTSLHCSCSSGHPPGTEHIEQHTKGFSVIPSSISQFFLNLHPIMVFFTMFQSLLCFIAPKRGLVTPSHSSCPVYPTILRPTIVHIDRPSRLSIAFPIILPFGSMTARFPFTLAVLRSSYRIASMPG